MQTTSLASAEHCILRYGVIHYVLASVSTMSRHALLRRLLHVVDPTLLKGKRHIKDSIIWAYLGRWSPLGGVQLKHA